MEITSIITHDLLPSGLIAQLVEQRKINYWGCGFDSHYKLYVYF